MPARRVQRKREVEPWRLLTVLYGCRPYEPSLERQSPCPVCKGNIKPGAWVYCEACGACGKPDHELRGEPVEPDRPRKPIRFKPKGAKAPA